MKALSRIIVRGLFISMTALSVKITIAQEVTAKYNNDKNTSITIYNNTGKIIYVFRNEKDIKSDVTGITFNKIQINTRDVLFFRCLSKTVETNSRESNWSISRNCLNKNFFYYIREGNKIETGKIVEIRPFNEVINSQVVTNVKVESDRKAEEEIKVAPDTKESEPTNQNRNNQQVTPSPQQPVTQRQPASQTTPGRQTPGRQTPASPIVATPITPKEDPRLATYRREYNESQDYFDNLVKDIHTEVIDYNALKGHKEKLDGIEEQLKGLIETDEVKVLIAEIIILRTKISHLIVEDKKDVRELEVKTPGKFIFLDQIIHKIEKSTGIRVSKELFVIICVSALIVVVVLVISILSLIRIQKIKRKKLKEREFYIRPLEEKSENVTVYTTGLDDVRKSRPGDFYVLEMNSIFEDTAIKTVYISRKCIMDIYKFVSEFLKSNRKTNETGCFVVGRWEVVSDSERPDYNITLEQIIKPGADAVYGEYTLDFGAEIGIGLENLILKLRTKTGKDYMQMCWIHTHPGLGLFLSNHDLIVQSQLVYPDHPNRMLAIVIDSNTENLDMAVFAPKHDGAMNNKDELMLKLSLEEIFQWAKKSRQETIDNLNPEYYSFITNYSNTFIEVFLLSGATIIDMDNAIALDTEGIAGFFFGNIHPAQKQVFIEEFKVSDNETNSKYQAVGCLLVMSDFSMEWIMNKYDSIINRYDFFVTYLTKDDSILFIVKNIEGIFLDDAEDIHTIQLLDMKKWTRRRRI